MSTKTPIQKWIDDFTKEASTGREVVDADTETLVASLVVGPRIEELLVAKDMAMIAKDIEYDGFDAKRMRAKIVSTLGATDAKVSLGLILMAYVSRGQNIDRIMKEARGTTRSKLATVVSQLNLKRRPTEPNKGETITLARVAICFTEMACQLAMAKKPVNQVDGDESIRPALRLPCFAGLIPLEPTETEKELLKAHMVFVTMQSQVWKGQYPACTESLMTEQARWVRSNMIGSYHSDEERRAALKILGISSLSKGEKGYATLFDSLDVPLPEA